MDKKQDESDGGDRHDDREVVAAAQQPEDRLKRWFAARALVPSESWRTKDGWLHYPLAESRPEIDLLLDEAERWAQVAAAADRRYTALPRLVQVLLDVLRLAAREERLSKPTFAGKVPFGTDPRHYGVPEMVPEYRDAKGRTLLRLADLLVDAESEVIEIHAATGQPLAEVPEAPAVQTVAQQVVQAVAQVVSASPPSPARNTRKPRKPGKRMGKIDKALVRLLMQDLAGHWKLSVLDMGWKELGTKINDAGSDGMRPNRTPVFRKLREHFKNNRNAKIIPAQILAEMPDELRNHVEQYLAEATTDEWQG